jgi:hypothetical protein
MEKIKGDKPVGGIIHIHMEMSQGNSLCSYFYLKQAKMSWFSFYLFSFFFYKIGKQEGGTNPPRRASKCKKRYLLKPLQERGRVGEGRIRRMVEEVNSCMIYLIHCRTCVNATLYSYPAQQ